MNTSQLTTEELLELYPDLPMENSPFACRAYWDKNYQAWHEAANGSPAACRPIHAALLRVRQTLIDHHTKMITSHKCANCARFDHESIMDTIFCSYMVDGLVAPEFRYLLGSDTINPNSGCNQFVLNTDITALSLGTTT